MSSIVSFSRLGVFGECQTKYRNRYVEKLPEERPQQKYFLIGTLAHSIVEEIISGTPPEQAVELVIPVWLKEEAKLPLITKPDEDDFPIFEGGVDPRQVTDYALGFGTLIKRASPHYNGRDKIRTKNGEVPKDVINYPTTSFKQAVFESGLQDLALLLNNEAAQCCDTFKRINLCDVIGMGAGYGLGFKVPTWVQETVAIEYPLDTQKVFFKDEIFWSGRIDWVVKTIEGATCIMDHKTGKKKKKGLEVAFDAQLNLYAYIWFEHYGVFPDYIGISHLPSGEFNMAQLDQGIVASVVQYYEEMQKIIDRCDENDMWLKRLPTEYNSPCISRSWSTGVVQSVCPYIQHCHPEYSMAAADEINAYLETA